MEKSLISLKNVSKSFVNGEHVNQVIKNINLDISKGEFTVIMGPSGSGKSTILYLLSGMDKVSNGEVIFDGVKLNDLNDKNMAEFRSKKIGFVFQGINLIPHLSLLQNVLIASYLVKKNKDEAMQKAKELFKSVGLENEMYKLPSQVSGGQSQRGAIVRALINNPEVIFADEPTGSLNSKNSMEVLDILSGLRDREQSIVMVTHDVKGAVRGDRILFITDGTIQGDLYLGKFEKASSAEREREIVSYLNEKGW